MNNRSPLDILIVEDNPTDALMIRKAFQLEELDSHLHFVSDGVDALALLKKHRLYAGAHRPELVFLDLNLPRMSGHEVLHKVKSDGELRSIPVVVFSNCDSTESVTKTYDLQASDFVEKPAHFAELTRVVQKIYSYWVEGVIPPTNGQVGVETKAATPEG